MRRRLGIMALLVLGAVPALCGCGGGGSDKRPTKEELAARVNALCVDYLSKANALGNPTSEAEVAKVIARTRDLYANAVAKMKKLEPPADEQADFDRLMELADKQLEIMRQEIIALKKHDTNEVARLLSLSVNTITAESNGIYGQLGATACVK